MLDLAPNGEPSVLFKTYLDMFNGDRSRALIEKSKVYSNAFINWFGDWINDPSNASKVVDENGEPLVVYHGTTSDFTTFSKEKLGMFTGAKSAKLAFFTASNEELAKDIYAQMESNEHFYQRMLKVDPNFTKDDLGIGPEESSTTDRIYSDFAEHYRDLELEYKDVLKELEKHRTTHKKTVNETISKAEEWVTDLGLEDYIKDGYAISDKQREEYENGKSITISKEIDVFDELNKIEAAKALNTERSREFARKYETLDKELKEALEKAEREDRNSYRNRVKALFINIKNPKIDSDYGKHYRAETYTKRIQDAINNNNDGGIIKDTRDPYRTNIYYFFEPNQVKSATDNEGSYSTTDDNIHKSKQGEKKRQRSKEVISKHQQHLNAVNQLLRQRGYTSDDYTLSKYGMSHIDDIIELVKNYQDVMFTYEGDQYKLDKYSAERSLREVLFKGKSFVTFDEIMDYLAKESIGYPQDVLNVIGNILRASKNTKGITMVMNFNLKEAAHYDYLSNTIRINPRAIFRNDSRTNNAAIQTIMHELVHAVTVETLKNSSILRKEAQELLDQVKDALGDDAKYYGLSNIYEFLAELTSEDFVKKLT